MTQLVRAETQGQLRGRAGHGTDEQPC